MIYKRCPHCKKRVPEGEKCGCGYKREYAAPDKTRKLYHSSRWQKTRAAVVSFYSGIDFYPYLSDENRQKAKRIYTLFAFCLLIKLKNEINCLI